MQLALTMPTTKELCSNDSQGLRDQNILCVCWEECGSQLSPYQARRQWSKMAFTRLDLWRKSSVTRKQSKEARIETSKHDPLPLLRCTLRLIAEAIITEPSIVVKPTDRFRAHVQPLVKEVRLMVEVCSLASVLVWLQAIMTSCH